MGDKGSSKTGTRLNGLLSNLMDQSAGAFPTAQAVVEQVVSTERRRFVRVRLSQLRPNPRQPRKVFDDTKLRELGASIKEHGLQQPLVIRAAGVADMYDIAAGERRWRAMLLENMTETEAIEVIGATDDEMETIAIIENVHRADLTPHELAEAYWRLHRTERGQVRMSIAEVAAYVKQSVDHVDSHLAIMRVPEAVRQLIIDDPTVPLRTIRDLGQVVNSADLDYLVGEVRSHRFTANDVTRMLQQVRKAQKGKTSRVPTRSNTAAVRGPDGSSASVVDGPARIVPEKNISPALALAALETHLRKSDIQVRRIVSALAEEVPTMDTDRKAAVRNQAQTWITLAQQLWELARED